MRSKYIIQYCAFCAVIVSGVCGCNSTPVRQEERALLPLNPVQQAVVQRRAAALKKVLAPLKVKGISVSLSSYRHRLTSDAAIMDMVKQLGFNRIYCRISSELELSEELQQLVSAASAARIPVELVVNQGDFRHRLRRGALLRLLLPQFRQLPDLAKEIVRFNEELPAGAKLAGVTVAFEPHRFTHANGAAEIPGLRFHWDISTFGKGLDNDNLVELSIMQLRMMKDALGALPLSVELPDFYPAWKKEGKLTKGSVKDFADIGKVMIRCTGNVPSQLVKRCGDAMKGNTDMLAVIPIADHTSVRTGALRRRDWNDLIKALGYFVNSSRKINCSGMVIRPLSELGYMLLEQD